jgi:hypothetical protein
MDQFQRRRSGAMPNPSDWTVSSSSGIGGSFLLAAEVGKYQLENNGRKQPLYWAGAGLNISVPGLPASASVSTSAHFSASGKVYFSKLAPHRINPSISAEQTFSGNGVILEMGVNSALTNLLGIAPWIRDWARGRGIHDWENQVCAQMLMFNTTNNLFGTILGVGLGDIIGILIELAATGDYSSISTQGIAFVASTSTGVDTAGVSAIQGAWVLW